MIELADAALEAWLATLDPPVDISFERPDGTAPGKRAVLSLVLAGVREQTDKRDNRLADIREDGRVVERRKATRWFELDYHCTVSGPARAAHRALGDVVQLLVDHDTVPAAHVPDELAALGHPIDVELAASPAGSAAVVVRVVLPVEPTPSREIGPPVTTLHMDMLPPPDRPAPREHVEGELVPLAERRWTTVRRRELLTRQPGGEGA